MSYYTTTKVTEYTHEIPVYTTSSQVLSTSQVVTSDVTTGGNLKTPTLTWEQFVLINVELDRLSTLCRSLAFENESLKSTQKVHLQEIETLRQNKASNLRISELEGRILSLTQENQGLHRELDSLRGSLAASREWESKSVHLASENQRLNSILTERLREIDVLRLRIVDLEKQGAATNELRSKLSLLASDNERLNGLLVERLREIDTLKIALSGAREWEHKYAHVAEENQRLNAILAERLREIDVLRLRIVELEKQVVATNDLRGKLALLASENERLSALLNERLKEIDTLKIALGAAREWEHKYAHLAQEHQRLNAILAERLREIDVLRLRIVELEKQTAQIGELRNKLSLLAADNERLNVLIIEKVRIIQEWEAKYSTLEALYNKVKISVEGLEEVKRSLVQSLEHTERKEPTLKQSHDEYVKRSSRVSTTVTNKTYHI